MKEEMIEIYFLKVECGEEDKVSPIFTHALQLN